MYKGLTEGRVFLRVSEKNGVGFPTVFEMRPQFQSPSGNGGSFSSRIGGKHRSSTSYIPGSIVIYLKYFLFTRIL